MVQVIRGFPKFVFYLFIYLFVYLYTYIYILYICVYVYICVCRYVIYTHKIYIYINCVYIYIIVCHTHIIRLGAWKLIQLVDHFQSGTSFHSPSLVNGISEFSSAFLSTFNGTKGKITETFPIIYSTTVENRYYINK